MKRIHFHIQGVVQGVGFRPFVYRLAAELGLAGWVMNAPDGVTIEIEGQEGACEKFLTRLKEENPPYSRIDDLQANVMAFEDSRTFVIKESEGGNDKTTLVMPDIATCPECLADIFDPDNRRYLYPFTNCTHCGPRYSIIEAIPYDRANTSMKHFHMCPRCQSEYDDPLDRRFHAQPNACPQCGPQLELWDNSGEVTCQKHEAMRQAVADINQGKVVAVKGLGGFHLMVDATNDEAVKRLRARKHREAKPLAIMFPSLAILEAFCETSAVSKGLLFSGEAPIVLLKNRRRSAADTALSEDIAPGNPYLGAMLPYTPLHHILLRELNKPVIATSGNVTDEPICIDQDEALERLKGIADLFLVHNRGIVRQVDDSVVTIIHDQPMLLRRARGYAPLPVQVKVDVSRTLAVGGHLKNTVALGNKHNVFISQHIGDLENALAFEAFEKTTKSLASLYEIPLNKMAADLHPDYFSTKYAANSRKPLKRVQHHHAHVVSCMAEHDVDEKVLGVAWDGTGYGPDKTIWGGEFLIADQKGYQRAGFLKTFRLPGGDMAVKEPRRSAIGLLYELYGGEVEKFKDLPSFSSFAPKDLAVILQMLAKNINAPVTSSAGRLFDAVASLAGLPQIISFEGQAAMALEFALPKVKGDDAYPVSLKKDEKAKAFIIDWTRMIEEVIADARKKTTCGTIALKFHNALVEAIILAAKEVGLKKVVLSGGCFQNRYLLECAITRLKEEGYVPFWHSQVPPNDGGIALGQLVSAVYNA